MKGRYLRSYLLSLEIDVTTDGKAELTIIIYAALEIEARVPTRKCADAKRNMSSLARKTA